MTIPMTVDMDTGSGGGGTRCREGGWVGPVVGRRGGAARYVAISEHPYV